MLRAPGSAYDRFRSSTMLKVKPVNDDDATVVGHQEGLGRHAGRLGALVCKLNNGIGFNVGTGFSDLDRETPPAIGSVICFAYQGLTDGGVPRFPRFLGMRAEQ